MGVVSLLKPNPKSSGVGFSLSKAPSPYAKAVPPTRVLVLGKRLPIPVFAAAVFAAPAAVAPPAPAAGVVPNR